MNRDSPSLEYLAKGYFHQDWDIEGPDARAILERFARANPRERIVEARDAAADMLALDLTDDELVSELDGCGLDYSPEAEGMTHRQWLKLVVETLTLWLEERPE